MSTAPKPTPSNSLKIVTAIDGDLTEDIACAATIRRLCEGRKYQSLSLRPILLSPGWNALYEVVQETKEQPLRTRICLDWLERTGPAYDEDPSDPKRMLRAYQLAEAVVRETPDEPEPEKSELFRDYGLDEFLAMDFTTNYIVDDVLPVSQPGFIAAPSKSMKTSVAVDLCVSTATGTPFLNRFNVPRPVRTLLISAESGGSKLQGTIKRVLASKGIIGNSSISEFKDNFRVLLNIPKILEPSHMEWLNIRLGQFKPSLLVYDPLYKGLAGGGETIEHSNVFQMGAAFDRINEICQAHGTSLLMVHHMRKSISAGLAPTLDQSAYAGLSEFARHWILLNREKAYVAGSGSHELRMVIGGSEGHEGDYLLQINEGRKADHDGQKWEAIVSDYDETSKGRNEADEGDLEDDSQTSDSKTSEILEFIKENDSKNKWGVSANQIRKGTKTGGSAVRLILNQLEMEKKIISRSRKNGDSNWKTYKTIDSISQHSNREDRVQDD